MSQPPILMVVTDPGIPDLDARVDAAIAGGANWVQYRDKTAASMERILWLARFRERHPDVLLLVNDDAEAARMTGASGVHLSERGLPAEDAGRVVGADHVIGRSLHWESFQKGTWRERGIGYLVFGPVFATASHPGAAPAGLARLKRVWADVTRQRPWMTILAIGGVDAMNAASCRQAGAAGVAVVRSVLAAADPAQAAADIIRAMEEP